MGILLWSLSRTGAQFFDGHACRSPLALQARGRRPGNWGGAPNGPIVDAPPRLSRAGDLLESVLELRCKPFVAATWVAVSGAGTNASLAPGDRLGSAEHGACVSMTKRITVINPNTSDALTATITSAAAAAAWPGVEVAGVRPAVGVTSVESHAEESIAAVGVLGLVRKHLADTDAFVIACFGDTGVTAAREVATCPVVGMTEAGLLTACLLAHRFAIITLPARTIAHSDRVVRALGLEHRCMVAAVDVPVSDLELDTTHLLPAFIEAARSAMAEDRAEAVVLGCAGLADLVAPLTAELGVPVIDGVAAAVNIAAGLVAMGLNTSRANTFAPVRLGTDFDLVQVDHQ